uniref:Tryptophan--tRNA ligase, cytoplasmic n=1 Tax=Arcella intermedia TaxID=1963864 RepID=A0A6B2L5Q8_9EUKA
MIDQALLDRFERVSGHPAHPWLKRGLFFSHRSLNDILDAVEKGSPFYLYTGRGPSSEALHLGHMVPFVFTKWLQDIFDVPLVIQLTDDEKFYFKDLSLEECKRLAIENAKDIIACGFDIKKTFIFRDTDYLQPMYTNIAKILRCLTVNQVKNIFGLDLSSNSGKFFYPAVQAAPSFSSSFPHIFGPDSNYHCLIPCAIDQDPFFRMTRDIAPRLNLAKPAVVHSKFFPALQGSSTKMSSSATNAVVSAIFMTDSEKDITDKVNKHAFSGGRATKKEHQELGGDLKVDVPYQYLRVFEFDDEKVKKIGDAFSSGKMLSGEIKKELINVLIPFINAHKEKRKKVDDALVAEYMKIRPLQFKGKKV